MAAKGHSNAEKLSRWEVLITNTKPALPDMPHLTEDVTALEQKLGEVRTLQSRQEDLRSQARAMRQQIETASKAGEKIRARIGASLKGKYGFENETLVKYGFKPRPLNIRRGPSKSKSEKSAGQGQPGSNPEGGAK
jgi:outer membrane murein-binding lipoprotein Lpp